MPLNVSLNLLIMAKEKLENFTIEKLRKRKKIFSILIVILIVVAVFDVSVLIYNLIIKNGFNISLFVNATACFSVSIPLYLVKKEIDEELTKRENN